MIQRPKYQQRRLLRRGFTIAFTIVLLSASALGNAGMSVSSLRAQERVLRVPLHVHHTPSSDRGDGWIQARIARANQIFEPHSVVFSLATREPLEALHARLPTRSSRDALHDRIQSGRINIFVVDYLADVDIAGREIRGVHWRYRQDRSQHYIILSRLGGLGVLAHELGHFLGNPRHSTEAGNVMSYEWGRGLPTFSRDQAVRIRRYLSEALSQGEIVEVAPKAP